MRILRAIFDRDYFVYLELSTSQYILLKYIYYYKIFTFYFPVEPNPPAPRVVSPKSSRDFTSIAIGVE